MSEMSYRGDPYEEGIDLLKAENAELENECCNLNKLNGEQVIALLELKAENERLRAALKELDTATHVYIASSPIDSVKVNFVMDKALLASKKALQTEEGNSNGE